VPLSPSKLTVDFEIEISAEVPVALTTKMDSLSVSSSGAVFSSIETFSDVYPPRSDASMRSSLSSFNKNVQDLKMTIEALTFVYL
jgi:hypothetical protein